MTTYTINEEQRLQLLEWLKGLFNGGAVAVWKLGGSYAPTLALEMLQSLTPNTQEPVEQNNDHVICPNCVHQFRAIPVNVQKLMIDAGFEPPFTHPAPQAKCTCMGEYRAIEQAVLSKQAKEPLIVKEALTGMVDAQIQAHFGRPTGGIEP